MTCCDCCNQFDEVAALDKEIERVLVEMANYPVVGVYDDIVQTLEKLIHLRDLVI